MQTGAAARTSRKLRADGGRREVVYDDEEVDHCLHLTFDVSFVKRKEYWQEHRLEVGGPEGREWMSVESVPFFYITVRHGRVEGLMNIPLALQLHVRRSPGI